MAMIEAWFQSLSRDSGRLNPRTRSRPRHDRTVSIPQSGFGAFELKFVKSSSGLSLYVFQSLSRDSGRLNRARLIPSVGGDYGFNPSVGIRGV